MRERVGYYGGWSELVGELGGWGRQGDGVGRLEE